ncbi:MAG: hypothetical protein AAFR04_16385, partial [Pseudomonadota bacterium]
MGNVLSGQIDAPSRWLFETGEHSHQRGLAATKRFGDFIAIDDVSLDIYEREFFALLGPSG